MAVFPKVQSPCPYKGNLAAVMEGDMCRMCHRQVFDLTHMSDLERVAFMRGCATEVCVSYSLRPAIAAAALAAAALTPSMAAAEPAVAEVEVEDMMIIVGGITDPANAQYVHVDTDGSLPDLPVVYEEEAPGPSGR